MHTTSCGMLPINRDSHNIMKKKKKKKEKKEKEKKKKKEKKNKKEKKWHKKNAKNWSKKCTEVVKTLILKSNCQGKAGERSRKPPQRQAWCTPNPTPPIPPPFHLVAIEIHHVSSLQHKKSRLLNLHSGQGNVSLNGALSGQRFAKCLARRGLKGKKSPKKQHPSVHLDQHFNRMFSVH